jgi:hypothetical protein
MRVGRSRVGDHLVAGDHTTKALVSWRLLQRNGLAVHETASRIYCDDCRSTAVLIIHREIVFDYNERSSATRTAARSENRFQPGTEASWACADFRHIILLDPVPALT